MVVLAPAAVKSTITMPEQLSIVLVSSKEAVLFHQLLVSHVALRLGEGKGVALGVVLLVQAIHPSSSRQLTAWKVIKKPRFWMVESAVNRNTTSAGT